LSVTRGGRIFVFIKQGRAKRVKGPCPASFLVTLLLFICTCTYVKMKAPQLMDPYRTGLRGLFWKAARIGERLSPWVAVCCLIMGLHTFWVGGK
jgi:hypothetical protein